LIEGYPHGVVISSELSPQFGAKTEARNLYRSNALQEQDFSRWSK
jgi:hypothetical protein